MNKSVLIITPFFAPQSHAPVFRMHKLAKYLPNYGWKPYIVTVDTNYMYNEDPTLLDELPPEVEIYRSRYIEPTLRGMRMALGGKDRTFSALKEKGQQAENHYEIQHPDDENTSELLGKTYRYLLNRYLKNPDAYWTWRKAAHRKAKELIDQYNIPIVITTFPPHTSFEIGAQLKEETGIKWVADFRDPGTYEQRGSSDYKSVYWAQRIIEDYTLTNANYKTVTSSVYPLLFNEIFGDKLENYKHIPTGIDEKLLPEKNYTKKNQIVFIGEFLKEYPDTFIKAFTLAKNLNRDQFQDCKLVFIGRKMVNQKLITPYINEFDLERDIIFIDHINQRDLYVVLKKSKAALLMSGTSRFSCNYAKMVDYIGIQIPVLADVPEISEARNELQKAGLGIFLDGTIGENAQKIVAFLKGEIKIEPNREYCKKYLASHQVELFSRLFLNILSNNI